MEQINQYTLTQRLQKLNENITIWQGENNEGACFEILTILKQASYERLLDRLIANEVKPLVNREIIGLQRIIEVGVSPENDCHFIVTEDLSNYESLQSATSSKPLHSLKSLATGLDTLKKENRQNYIISPQNIFIDNKGNVKLACIGLYELFKNQDLLEKDYLSPQAFAWLSDSTKPRPNFQDDIFALVKSFEQHLPQEIIEKALAPNRTDRFSKYYELIELLDQTIAQTPQTIALNIQNTQVALVATQREYTENFAPILVEMNQNVYFLVESKLSEKGEITGRFSTNNWKGKFYIDNGGKIFIDFKSCRNERDRNIKQNPDSFLATFSFSLQTNNFNCLPFFKEKNQLAQLNQTKIEAVKLWQTLPDKEREFIEETAFKVQYTKRETSKSNQANIKFSLKDASRQQWTRLKELKNEGVVLCINEQPIGKVLDYKQNTNELILKDIFCTIDEINNNGELIEDIRQQTSQFKKQVEACKKFEQGDINNPELCAILATPETAVLSKAHTLYEGDYENFKEQLFNPNLKTDDTQREAVLEALHHKPIFLIQGPPGTGKTTIIVELIQQLLKSNKNIKILVTSQGNDAIDNVFKRLHEKEIDFMRIASDNSLENDKISTEIIPHTYENKLKTWVSQTEQKSKDYFAQTFATQQAQTKLIELYDAFRACDKQKDFKTFKIDITQNYFKTLFQNVQSFEEAQTIFEQQLGKDFIKLKNLQRDWFAFLGGVTINEGTDRKKSMLNDGSAEINFLTAMMRQINVIGATCIHIASSKYSRINFCFDYVIMDESSKATPAEALVPINMGQNIILIGDHKQLPPTITREQKVEDKIKAELEDNGIDMNKDFGESLFEKLIKSFENDEAKKFHIKMLDIQYRMPKQIGTLISKYFYDGKLKSPDTAIIPNYDQQKHHELQFKKETSIVFITTSQKPDRYDNDNKFKRQNKCNVETIKEILTQLNQLYPDNLQKETPFNIGIIAGYRGQIELLKSSINTRQYTNFTQEKKKLIEINTVDKFQGAERDIIIYDVVRSSPSQGNIGFLDDYRRINVAFSRAKRLLIIVGDSDYLIKRATLNPNGKFNVFKLQQIAQELDQQGLIFNNLTDLLI